MRCNAGPFTTAELPPAADTLPGTAVLQGYNVVVD